MHKCEYHGYQPNHSHLAVCENFYILAVENDLHKVSNFRLTCAKTVLM